MSNEKIQQIIRSTNTSAEAFAMIYASLDDDLSLVETELTPWRERISAWRAADSVP